jgi:hypothetical protein
VTRELIHTESSPVSITTFDDNPNLYLTVPAKGAGPATVDYSADLKDSGGNLLASVSATRLDLEAVICPGGA